MGNLRRGSAEKADMEIAEAILKGGLGLNHALEFQNCPFRAIALTAAALHLYLHPPCDYPTDELNSSSGGGFFFWAVKKWQVEGVVSNEERLEDRRLVTSERKLGGKTIWIWRQKGGPSIDLEHLLSAEPCRSTRHG